MPRHRLDPDIAAARLQEARRQAKHLNAQLPSPHVFAHATRYGRVVVYYEPPDRRKVRLRAPYPSEEFDHELAAAKIGKIADSNASMRGSSKRQYPEHTLGWLLKRYYEEDDVWRTYVDHVRRQADLNRCVEELVTPDGSKRFGDIPLRAFNAQTVSALMQRKRSIQEIVDQRTMKPRTVLTNATAANQRRKWLSVVLDFGVQIGALPVNHAKSVKRARPDRLGRAEDGFATWPKWLLEAYRAVHPHGTLARLVLELALYTTARKSDLPILGRHLITKHDKNGLPTLTYVQHKNRNRDPVKVWQPIFPELQTALDHAQAAGLLGEVIFLVQKKRPGEPDKPYGADTLSNYVRIWVDAALTSVGLEHPPGRNGYCLHGLRKSGICTLIERGVPDRWIMAISGHRDPRMISLYAREFMREFGAEGAASIWMAKPPLSRHDDDDLHGSLNGRGFPSERSNS
jgi:hypothetical protein